jgi:hypothetical protein
LARGSVRFWLTGGIGSRDLVATWIRRTINLAEFAAQGVNLTNVDTVSINSIICLIRFGRGGSLFSGRALFRIADEAYPAARRIPTTTGTSLIILIFDFSISLAIPPEFHYNITPVSFQNSNNAN